MSGKGIVPASLPDLARMADKRNDAGTAKVLKKDN
jgi:hypothetical protein